jgi:hypothetical protein
VSIRRLFRAEPYTHFGVGVRFPNFNLPDCAHALLARFLKRLPAAGVADKELSVLLARDQLVPIVHNTTYEALREVSPMLASRNGLDTAEMPMADVAAKLAELVAA